ncbi:DUF456 domain-containing protein [Dermabacteraceae bacterium TAE3-ERU27]|nr:DUF456 domain-containing protein [Dermabacteraceae bacterium TAE3-ERU27]
MGPVQAETLVGIGTLLVLVLGTLGIIFPVLPGSLLVLAGLGIWAFFIPGWHGWLPLAVAGPLVVAGALASFLLAGKTVRERQVPQRSLLIAVVGAIVGIFAIPFLGLFIGFSLGLFGAEYLRLKAAYPAWESALAVLKSVGLGILLELAAALSALTVWSLVVLHFWLG